MAKKVWNGTTSTSFNLAGNWTPSGVPTTGDELWFMSSTPNACVADMDRSATAQINFARVVIGREYNRDLGTAADPLYAGIDVLEHEGPNAVYLRANDFGTPKLPIDNLIQKDGLLFLDLRGSGVESTLLNVERGTCTLQAGRLLTAQMGGNSSLEILAAMALLTDLNIDAGQVITRFAGHNKIQIGSGTLILEASAAVTTGDAKIINRRGVIRYKSDGDVTNIETHKGSLLTVRGNENEGPMTINTLNQFGGLVDVRNTSRNVVITNWIVQDSNSRFGIPARTTVTLADI